MTTSLLRQKTPAYVAPPALITLTDTFAGASLDTTKWHFDNTNAGFATSGAMAVTGGQLVLSNGSTLAFDNDSFVLSNQVYNLIGSSIVGRLTYSTPTSGTYEAGLILRPSIDIANNPNGNTALFMTVEINQGTGVNTFFRTVENAGTFSLADSSGSYSATNDAWFRIRESGGTLFWDTAPDSSGSPGTWVNRTSTATTTATFDLTKLIVQLYYRVTAASPPVGTATVSFDVINPPAGATVSLTGDAATAAVGTVTVSDTKIQTGNVSTAAVGTSAVTVSKTQTGNAATGAAGTNTVSSTNNLTGGTSASAPGSVAVSSTSNPAVTGASAASAVNSVAPSVVRLTTGNVSATAPGSVAVSINKGVAGDSATTFVGSVAENDTVLVSGTALSAVPGNLSPTITLLLTGVPGAGAAGNVTPNGPPAVPLLGNNASGLAGTAGVSSTSNPSITGATAAGVAGSLRLPQAASPGKNHHDLYIRQLLEEYYTKEWTKEQPKPPEIVAPGVRKRRVRQAIEELVPEDPMLSVAVSRLATQQQALRVSLASLQHSFNVQSRQLSAARATREEEDDDLLLLSSVI